MSFAIKPTQVEVEDNVQDKSMITLITCSDFNTSKYGYGQHRTVAQGDLISKMKATKHNLALSELTAKPKHSKKEHQVSLKDSKQHKAINKTVQVRANAKPRFYQNMTFIRTVIIIFNIVFVLAIGWRLIHIWFLK